MNVFETISLKYENLYGFSGLKKGELINPFTEFAFKGLFDFELVGHLKFLSDVLNLSNCGEFLIQYIDFNNEGISKVLSVPFKKDQEMEASIYEFRVDHSGLHNCEVEGSYVLTVEGGRWTAFYDGAIDMTFFLSNDISQKEFLADLFIEVT